MKNTIERKITNSFNVLHLQVEDESHMHNVPAGAQSHFKVTLVSDDFAGMGKVKMHQAIYKVLADELAGSVHALALHTYDKAAWEQLEKAPDSPQCMGGGK
jgi:BolA protein